MNYCQPGNGDNVISDGPHRRYNPLRGEWVLVSPGRLSRPWQGARERSEVDALPRYDSHCYLCPGNERAGGKRNPDYTHCYVFDNDFSALGDGDTAAREKIDGLLRTRSEFGVCRVVCYSPRHDLSLAAMDEQMVRRVVDCWSEQTDELGMLPEINHVLVFENRGEAMGCSNPHPHGQIWAQGALPGECVRELEHKRAYHAEHGSRLLRDYLAQELSLGERIVLEESDFVAVVPYWAVWPYETLVVSRQQHSHIQELEASERDSLARLLHGLTAAYDALFDAPFPYTMGIHQAPTDGRTYPEWDLHLHFYPPLLRSASVRKFMVGYEMLADPQRDMTPEDSAARLREAFARSGI